MKPTILIIQFRLNEAHRALERASIDRELGESVHTEYISALDDTLSWAEPETLLLPYDGSILGGSGDFDFDGGRTMDDNARIGSYEILERLRPLFEYIFHTDLPTLGICFGHQLIGSYSGAIVRHDPEQKKSRSHAVYVIDRPRTALLKGVPDSFYAHYGHKDSLDRIPDGAILLVHGGDACRVSALQYGENIYTTQFHPELNVEDMYKRLELLPGYLPEGVSVEEVFTTDTYSNTIIHNFGSLVTDLREKRRTNR